MKIFQNKKKYIVIGIVILLVVLYFTLGGGASVSSYTVGKANIEQSVMLSGKVETSDKADLGFASSGRLARINVKNNQQVSRGQVLAQLEVGDLLADLKIKQANYKTSDTGLESDVENAYRLMLSDDLVLVPESESYDLTPPQISGVYEGAEGRYKIIISNDSVNTFNQVIATFDLEKTNREINKNGPTPLGTKGLYISFGDVLPEEYDGTIWYLDIPNKASTSYVVNYNAYIDAKKKLEASAKIGGDVDASSAIARAEIEKINAEIRKNTIYAPFDGKVTNIEKEVGESASVGERIVSVLGDKKLEVVLQVSELDVSRIPSNSPITVSIDAFSNEVFSGVLKTINSRETEVDGVPVYEAFVELPSDPRVKTGMSASGKIILESKLDVLAIPSYLVEKVGDTSTVEVITVDNKIEKREVTLGLLGTDSMVEVVSGLSEGEKISSNQDAQ